MFYLSNILYGTRCVQSKLKRMKDKKDKKLYHTGIMPCSGFHLVAGAEDEEENISIDLEEDLQLLT